MNQKQKYNPLVTIVIPVYNGSNYVAEAIDSALNQTYENTEIIVVNDGSTDNGATEKVVMSYGNQIRYYPKKNGGVSSALNLAIREMKGEWLSWLSHDDRYKPTKIEEQVNLLNQIANKSGLESAKKLCVYGATERINADGKFISKRNYHVPENQTARESLLFNIKSYSIGGCTVLMSKEVLDDVGGFDENLRTVSDADLWFRMMRKGYRFVFLDSVIVQSRQHNEQVGNKSMSLFEKEHAELMLKITKELIEDGLSVDEEYELAEGLVVNGFNEAADLVLSEIKREGKSKSFKNIKINVFVKLRYKGFILMRSIYRKLTLK